jgi:uncharacterized protein (DUF779 family)
MTERVRATPAALELLAQIQADHGPVLFHQSGGCCDGSSPMCYPQGDFLLGDHDVKLGEIGGAPVYLAARSSSCGATLSWSSMSFQDGAACSRWIMGGSVGS